MPALAHSSPHSPAPDDWYERSFGQLYPLIYRHRDDASARAEIDHIIALLNLRPSQRVLDVACGAGRHTHALLQRGLDPVGVDLSWPLLQLAAQRPGLPGRLVRADIRNLPFNPAFDAALNLFTSFGYFLDEAHNHAALAQIARSLKPAGLFLIDLINPPHLHRTFQPHTRRLIDGIRIENHRSLTDQRIVNHITLTEPTGRQRQFTESVRLYSPAELRDMMRLAGLDLLRLVGDFAGQPFTENSPRLIAIARRCA